MKILRYVILFCICTSCLSIFACTTKLPEHTVALVEDTKMAFGKSSTEVVIRVSPSTSKAALEKLLNNLLPEYFKRSTSIGRTEFVSIYAYYNNDAEYKNRIASIYQGIIDGSVGRIAFEYGGKVTHDRKEDKPVMSHEEKARQEEVGKFAGEMLKEAEKIRNNK